jgi:hypothetical protein
MRFEASGTYLAAQADVDPVAAPATLLENHMLLLQRRQPDGDVLGSRILLALEAPAGETLSVELWALDEDTQGGDTGALRRLYLIGAAAVVVTANQLAEVTVEVPPGGKVYARRTADTIAALATRRLLATCVP